ncbi:MAG TPA: lysophospholipid acyltransferase family protein [Terriglobales bacterium]|nr:lysophospholipid acyltransferase family protein [Terriglobales bacterium]
MKTPTTELDNTAEGAEPASGVRPDSSPRAAVSRRYGWLSRLRSYFIFDPLIWLVTVILGIVSIPVSLLGEKGRILHGFARFWSQLIMKIIYSPTTVTGLDALDTSRPLVYAVNHASALDIPVLYVYLPFQFRIAFKKELLAYPIVGWHLRRSGQICINQQNPAASIGSIRAALKSLKSGLPLVIFPEGGRTPDGQVKPFLPGAFFLAIKAQVDIVPVALVGTYELLPMDTYHIKCRPLEMRVGQPIATAGYTPRNMAELSDKVHRAVEDLHAKPVGQ